MGHKTRSGYMIANAVDCVAIAREIRSIPSSQSLQGIRVSKRREAVESGVSVFICLSRKCIIQIACQDFLNR